MFSKVPKEQIQGLLATGLVKAVIEYKRGGIWVSCEEKAYDVCGRTATRLLDLFRQLPQNSLRGHDSCGKAFGRRCAAKGCIVHKPVK